MCCFFLGKNAIDCSFYLDQDIIKKVILNKFNKFDDPKMCQEFEHS